MTYIGFESGGTKLVVTLYKDQIVDSKTLKRPHHFRAVDSLQLMISTAETLLLKHRIDPKNLIAIGFGFGGSVDQLENRPTLCIHEEGWEDIDALTMIQEKFQVPVFFVNDCFAAALAEAIAGQEGSFESLFYVTLGTGVGGALVVNENLLLTGREGNAEVGHLKVTDLPLRCPCGRDGCLEAVCSGPGLTQLANYLYPEYCQAIEGFKAEHVTKGYLMKDDTCVDILHQYTKMLGIGLTSVINLMCPDRIVLGGGLGDFVKQNLESELVQFMKSQVFPPFKDSIFIHSWTIKEGAVSLGAILYAKQRLHKSAETER